MAEIHREYLTVAQLFTLKTATAFTLISLNIEFRSTCSTLSEQITEQLPLETEVLTPAERS